MSKDQAPLEIKDRHVGITATRVSLNSGSYVVCTNDGRYICIHRKCIDARIADKCEHVEFVRANDPGDPHELTDAVDLKDALVPATVESDPYLNEYRFAGPSGGVFGMRTPTPEEPAREAPVVVIPARPAGSHSV